MSDSACDVPDDIARRLDIEIIPLRIRFGDDEYTDRTELTPKEFWAKCKASKVLPETSAPSPGAFQTAYERAHRDGCDGVVVLTLSAALSATHQSAVLGAEAVASLLPIRVLDTKAVTMAQGLLAIDVAELANTGATLDEVHQRAESLVTKVGVCAMLDTLEHLVKGGRVGGARALLGQVLAVKPLLELKDGVVAEAGRQRTRARAIAAIAAVAQSHAPLRRLALVHGAAHDLDALSDVARTIASEFPLVVADIGPVAGTHGGPGMIGLCWIEA